MEKLISLKQLDELSTDTLSSYSAKAQKRKLPTQQYDRQKGMVHKDASGKEISSQEAGRQVAKHVQGIKRAGDKILKNANKNIKHDSSPKDYSADIQRDYEKNKNRYHGDSFMPIGDMIPEGVQLDELSSDLLARYKKKASEQSSAQDKEAFSGTVSNKRAQELLNKSNKRYKGIIKATGKQFDNDMKKQKNEGVEQADAAIVEEVKHNEIHVSDAGGGKYKVHAVGKKFAIGVKPGEHLTDTHLDDFAEMGGKVKMVKPKKD